MNTLWMDMREGIDAQAMKRAGALLKEGALVAFPTETVYGLGGHALLPRASADIYAAKGRPSDNPLIVHIANRKALPDIAARIPPQALALADAFWPGPLTMIFQKTEAVPYETTGGLNTVAVRMPVHPIALALIEAGGGFVAAPSANRSGRPSPTTAAHVKEDLDGRIAAIIDGGPVEIGVESTIVDLTGDIPMVLRPGFISQAMLREVIGPVELDPALEKEDPSLRPKAPGMKYRHYAPRAQMLIVIGEPDDVCREIGRLTGEAIAAGEKVGILASEETKDRYKAGIVRCVGSRQREMTISQHLYGTLREFDALGVTRIYSEAFDTPQLGGAIMNRLVRAAGHKILYL